MPCVSKRFHLLICDMAFRHGTEIRIVEVSPLSAANELGTLGWYKQVGQVRVVTVTADAPKDRFWLLDGGKHL